MLELDENFLTELENVYYCNDSENQGGVHILDEFTDTDAYEYVYLKCGESEEKVVPPIPIVRIYTQDGKEQLVYKTYEYVKTEST